MKTSFLDFEQQIADLESKIESLRASQQDSKLDLSDEIERLEKKTQQLIKDVYAKLTPWQTAQVARHPQRPYTLDYIRFLFTDYQELRGDRAFAPAPPDSGARQTHPPQEGGEDEENPQTLSLLFLERWKMS